MKHALSMQGARAAAVVGLLLMATLGRADDGKKALKELQGKWLVESGTLNGKELNMKGGQFVFVGNKLTLEPAKGKASSSDFELDASKKPRTITIEAETEGGHTRGPYRGIYKIDGDTLTICWGPPNRVTNEFTDKEQMLYILKRQK